MTVYRLYLDLEMLKAWTYFVAQVMESGMQLLTPTSFEPNKTKHSGVTYLLSFSRTVLEV